jgi:hypothetical protein
MTAPEIVDRTTWQAEVEALRIREKADAPPPSGPGWKPAAPTT